MRILVLALDRYLGKHREGHVIKQVNDAVGTKTDAASTKAKALAAEAQTLHAAGKHAESVAKAEEAAKTINLTLTKK